MSRFKKDDRENFQRMLLEVGEVLFNQHGLLGISVDDITKEVGIGKGTFYHFYKNKEHLYMEICNLIQDRIFSQVNMYLEKDIDSKTKFRETINFIFDELIKVPMIYAMDEKIYKQLQNKVPEECMDCNDARDLKMTEMLAKSGISFNIPIEKVNRIIQLLFVDKTLLLAKDDTDTIEILINSVCQYIVQ